MPTGVLSRIPSPTWTRWVILGHILEVEDRMVDVGLEPPSSQL